MKLRTRNRLMDALYHEQLSLNEVKRQLMYTYQFPARIAKSSCTGLITVQKRCKPVQHRGLFWVELCALALNSELSTDFFYSDVKPENFGYLGGKLVKLDYGD
ncbi:hypothetical protein [Salmonella phage SD-1_S14]|nr:hypothetical protein [Salmonella phage SD-1_S14]